MKKYSEEEILKDFTKFNVKMSIRRLEVRDREINFSQN